ncbi:hypothetical protein WJX82_011289 [Trebouxia sp. C0006]
MSPLTAITGLYSQGLLYGGPVVLIWSWVFTGAVTILVGLAMSELSSAFPVSGGLYFWSFMLAGKYGPVASWCVGWINLLGQIAFVAGNTYTFVEVLAAMMYLATQDQPSGGYSPSNSMQLYIYGGLLVIYASVNTFTLKSLTQVARIGAIWQVAGAFVIAVTLLSVAEKRQKWSWVLTDFEPNPASGITSPGYICLLGLLTACWSFTGYDSAAHLIEETISGDLTAGWPMLYAIITSFTVGLLYLLSLTATIQDITTFTDPSAELATVSYVAQIMWDAFESRYSSGHASLVLMMVPLGSCWFCGLLSVTSASRMLYGFSRDQAVPFWRIWTHVDAHSGVPVNAVWGVVAGAFVMSLPLLQGVTAFLATTSIATVGLALAYGMPIGLHLINRNSFEPGPFTLGRWSFSVGLIAFIWLMFTSVIFMLPGIYPITSVTLNYAPVAIGGVLLLIAAAWVLSAQFWFSGPKIEVDNSDIVKVNYWISDPPRHGV